MDERAGIGNTGRKCPVQGRNLDDFVHSPPARADVVDHVQCFGRVENSGTGMEPAKRDAPPVEGKEVNYDCRLILL
jgi:hypothetical protein